jgi:hypothetical protein
MQIIVLKLIFSYSCPVESVDPFVGHYTWKFVLSATAGNSLVCYVFVHLNLEQSQQTFKIIRIIEKNNEHNSVQTAAPVPLDSFCSNLLRFLHTFLMHSRSCNTIVSQMSVHRSSNCAGRLSQHWHLQRKIIEIIKNKILYMATICNNMKY